MNLPSQERFLKSLPEKPYCSDNLKSGLIIRKKETALTKPYIQLSQHKKSYLAFDLDYEGAAFGYENISILAPEPTITVINPDNAHAHLLYELTTPVLFPLANAKYSRCSRKARNFFHSVRESYTQALNADPGFSGLIVKNPFNERWRVIWNNRSYELAELAEWVDLSKKPQRKKPQQKTDALFIGRNCTLFDECRFHSYETIIRFDSLKEFWDYLYLFCRNYNKQYFESPLPESGIRSISKSVSKWTWERRECFTGRRLKNIGVMDFPKIENLSYEDYLKECTRRRKLSAERTNKIRKENTEQAILKAILELREKGEKVNKAKVAKMAGLERRTVYYFQYLFETEESLKQKFLDERVKTNKILMQKFNTKGWESPMIQGCYNSFINKIFPDQKVCNTVLSDSSRQAGRQVPQEHDCLPACRQGGSGGFRTF